MQLSDINGLYELQNWMMLHHRSHKIIIIIGLLVAVTFLVHAITRKYRIPSVVGYILIGSLFSVSVLKHIPYISEEFIEWYDYFINSFNFVTILAVSFISFTIGTSLSINVLKKLEIEFALIVLLESLGAFVLVTGGMLLLGEPVYEALVMGAIATATAPAATVIVLKEYGVQGELSATLMIVLALDEALALIIFNFVEPIALMLCNSPLDKPFHSLLWIPTVKIVGSVLLGLVVGYFSQKAMAKSDDKNHQVMLILATVFGLSALAIFLDLSPLITNISVGFAYRNFARKYLGISRHIDTLTIPLYAIFFILAGTKLQITSIMSKSFLMIALVYTLGRAVGKIGGATMGARLSNAPKKVQKYIGVGLLPQIGVAFDLAFIVQRDFIHLPEQANEISMLIFNIILFTTVLTEVTGSFATEYALIKSGEIKK